MFQISFYPHFTLALLQEIERSELLDQFRNLNQEAMELETNNHSLEDQASQTKVQLSLTLEHVSELERKIETHESTIRSYEKQVCSFTLSLVFALNNYLYQVTYSVC